VAAVVVASGCGSTKKRVTPASTAAATTAASTTSAAGPGALQGEAQSAATGDIPDNQVYVTFSNARGGYTIKYPEGWAQRGNGARVVFRDKNNLVRIVIVNGTRATLATAGADMQALKSSVPSLKFKPPVATRIGSAPAIKVTYTTESAANPVTNKRVTLTVDRYYLFHAGERALVDLGTPVGVDNVDAYRMMIQSFRWR
jgi:PsbP